MSDVTRILSQIESGDPSAAEQLLPLVYEELRKLAAAKMAQEKPGQTLQATALVHEAYIRLVDAEKARTGIAAGIFLRLLPRRCAGSSSTGPPQKADKRGRPARRVAWTTCLASRSPADELLDLHEALNRWPPRIRQAAQLD